MNIATVGLSPWTQLILISSPKITELILISIPRTGSIYTSADIQRYHYVIYVSKIKQHSWLICSWNVLRYTTQAGNRSIHYISTMTRIIIIKIKAEEKF